MKCPKIALVGAGRMGQNHLHALGRGKSWTLVAVVDRHPERCPELVAGLYESDLGMALERATPLAVVVAVPPEAHQAVARACLGHGCHVLLEKPLCPSYRQAVQLAEEFRRVGRILFGGHSERFHPVFLAMQSQLSRVGEVSRIEAFRRGPPPRRLGDGGVVLDLAIHDLDLVRRLVAGPIWLDGEVPSELDDSGGVVVSARARLRWSNGSASLEASWGEPRRRFLRVSGVLGVLEADLLARTLVLRTDTGSETIVVPWADPLEAEHEAFLGACRGAGDPWADLAPQLEAIDLAEKILGVIR